jgi:hypothetical protein
MKRQLSKYVIILKTNKTEQRFYVPKKEFDKIEDLLFRGNQNEEKENNKETTKTTHR